MPVPLMGFPLQSFVPLAQPYCVPAATTLLSLTDCVLPALDPTPKTSDFTQHVQQLPAFRVLLRPRIRHSYRRIRPTKARGSLGLRPPRFSPSPELPGLHQTSPHEITNSHVKQTSRFSTGYQLLTRLVGLRRDYRPSWDSLPSDSHKRIGCSTFLESPPQKPRCVTVRCTSSSKDRKSVV